MKNKDGCSTSHCRGSCDINYLGRHLCWSCWKKKSEESD